MQTTLENWEGQLLQQPLSPESFRATRFSIVPTYGREIQHMAGWNGYAKTANTFKLRNRLNERINEMLPEGL